MYTQFFGSYLLKIKVIDNDTLIQAMKSMSSTHIKLGTLAIHYDFMTAFEVDGVKVMQTHTDKRFGDLALEAGYLSLEQINYLIALQPPSFLILGQTLVDNHHLTNTQLENIILDYRTEHQIDDNDLLDESKEKSLSLISHFFQLDDLPFSDSVTSYLDLLLNNLIRFVGDDFTPLPATAFPEIATNYCSSQEICRNQAFITAIDMNESTAVAFACRYTGDLYDTYDEFVSASLDDFLNLHNGLFLVNLSNNQGIEATLTPPLHHDNQILAFSSRTYLLPVVFPFGTIHFVFTFPTI